jgi:hypothetical protein
MRNRLAENVLEVGMASRSPGVVAWIASALRL